MRDRKAIEAVTANVVESLIGRSRTSRCGIYWDSVPPHAANRRSLALSIMTGTPGILALLIEYYSISSDSRVLPTAIGAVNWLLDQCRCESAPSPGLYAGTAGALYVAWQASRIGLCNPGECVELLAAHTRYTLSRHEQYHASVGNGMAGNALAIHLVNEDAHSEELLALEHELLKTVVQHVRLASGGIYWDRYPDSIRPNLGFVTGNAGLEFLLSQYVCPHDESLQLLLQSTIDYDRSHYSVAEQRWPDFVNEGAMNDLEEVARLHQAVRKRDPLPFFRPGESFGWANGTAGILLARAAMRRVPPSRLVDTEINLSQRILAGQLRDRRGFKPDMSLATGITGACMCMAYSAQACANDYLPSLLEATIGEVVSQWEGAGAFRFGGPTEPWQVGLLNGEAGVAYFLLRWYADVLGQPSLLAPAVKTAGRFPISLRDVTAAAARAAFPRTIKLLSGTVGSEGVHTLNLDTVARAVGIACARESARVETFEWERAMQDYDGSSPAYIYMFTIDAYRAQVYNSYLSWLHDDELLSLKFRLCSEVRLVVRKMRDGGEQWVLWRQTPNGVKEARLTAMQYLVCSLLVQRSTGARVVRRALNRSPAVQGMDSEISEQVAACLRVGLKAGILEHDDRPISNIIREALASWMSWLFGFCQLHMAQKGGRVGTSRSRCHTMRTSIGGYTGV